MTQTLLVVVLFVAGMACLPWLVRRLQQRQAVGATAAGSASRVLSAVAIGPQQRVVTVEVGPEHARTWLVLGVTAQQVSCLHVLPITQRVDAPVSIAKDEGVVSAKGSFHQEMSSAMRDDGGRIHG